MEVDLNYTNLMGGCGEQNELTKRQEPNKAGGGTHRIETLA